MQGCRPSCWTPRPRSLRLQREDDLIARCKAATHENYALQQQNNMLQMQVQQQQQALLQHQQHIQVLQAQVYACSTSLVTTQNSNPSLVLDTGRKYSGRHYEPTHYEPLFLEFSTCFASCSQQMNTQLNEAYQRLA